MFHSLCVSCNAATAGVIVLGASTVCFCWLLCFRLFLDCVLVFAPLLLGLVPVQLLLLHGAMHL
jgi:hypothetical protein